MTAREAELIQQLAECQEALAAALRQNQLLRQKVDLLVRRVSGSSSENLDSAQRQLLQLSEVPAVPESPSNCGLNSKHLREPSQSNLLARKNTVRYDRPTLFGEMQKL